jgi:hypothetical protein
MIVQQGKQSNQKRTLEFLARESKVSVDEVVRLYEDERAQLEADALITSFLPIFAIRNVREMLRQRSGGKRSVLAPYATPVPSSTIPDDMPRTLKSG